MREISNANKTAAVATTALAILAVAVLALGGFVLPRETTASTIPVGSGGATTAVTPLTTWNVTKVIGGWTPNAVWAPYGQHGSGVFANIFSPDEYASQAALENYKWGISAMITDYSNNSWYRAFFGFAPYNGGPDWSIYAAVYELNSGCTFGGTVIWSSYLTVGTGDDFTLNSTWNFSINIPIGSHPGTSGYAYSPTVYFNVSQEPGSMSYLASYTIGASDWWTVPWDNITDRPFVAGVGCVLVNGYPDIFIGDDYNYSAAGPFVPYDTEFIGVGWIRGTPGGVPTIWCNAKSISCLIKPSGFYQSSGFAQYTPTGLIGGSEYPITSVLGSTAIQIVTVPWFTGFCRSSTSCSFNHGVSTSYFESGTYPMTVEIYGFVWMASPGEEYSGDSWAVGVPHFDNSTGSGSFSATCVLRCSGAGYHSAGGTNRQWAFDVTATGPCTFDMTIPVWDVDLSPSFRTGTSAFIQFA